MAAFTAITHPTTAHAQLSLAEKPAAPAATASGTTSGASGSNTAGTAAATISANDFLTLLVTEMQNQDPTANTDPNEYVNQLVNVNSLEQLISINQTLSGALGTSGSSGSTGTTGSSGAVTGATAPASGMGTHPLPMAAIAEGRTSVPAGQPNNQGDPPRAAGNLTVPLSSAAAERVSHALGGVAPSR